MTRAQLSSELMYQFPYWRVHEYPGMIIIKLPKGCVSVRNLEDLIPLIPTGTSVYVETYSWFYSKLLTRGWVKNYHFIDETEHVDRVLKYIQPVNLFLFTVNLSLMAMNIYCGKAGSAAVSGFAVGICLTQNFRYVLDLKSKVRGWWK